MSSRSEVNDDPLAIIHLYLAGMDPHGSPPRLVYESFRSYFHPNDLLFFELEFDPGTLAKEADHQSKMASLVERLRRAQVARVLLFITTHSEENRGDLFLGHCDHGGPEGPVADEVTKVSWLFFCIEVHNAHVVFSSSKQSYAEASRHSLLVARLFS